LEITSDDERLQGEMMKKEEEERGRDVKYEVDERKELD